MLRCIRSMIPLRWDHEMIIMDHPNYIFQGSLGITKHFPFQRSPIALSLLASF